MTEAAMNDALRDGLHKKFKLTTTVSTSNMHLFNKDGVIC
jgi:DNA topoisomerase-2